MVSITSRIQKRAEEVKALSVLWSLSIKNQTCPNSAQFMIWLNAYGVRAVEHGINQAAIKYSKLEGDISPDGLVRFATSCMKGFSIPTFLNGQYPIEIAWEAVEEGDVLAILEPDNDIYTAMLLKKQSSFFQVFSCVKQGEVVDGASGMVINVCDSKLLFLGSMKPERRVK